MEILAIVKTTMEDQFCTITWIDLPYQNCSYSRIWTGYVQGRMETTHCGDQPEMMEREISHLLSCGWSRII